MTGISGEYSKTMIVGTLWLKLRFYNTYDSDTQRFGVWINEEKEHAISLMHIVSYRRKTDAHETSSVYIALGFFVPIYSWVSRYW